MNGTEEIFVSLLDEGVDVWRPVRAVHLHGNVYRIADQSYDNEVETWQFVPGDEVFCEMIDSNDGRIFAATRKA
jgi:hypothetical protein